MIAGITEKEQKIIERILDKYCKDYAFFYYGSRVKGTYEKTSDLDVLIKGKAEMPLAVLQEIKEEFDKSDLPYIVNFSDYYKLDSSFYERIKPDLIPYNWQEVKLGDVCDLIAGFAFKSKDFGNYPDKVIKITNIEPPFVNMTNLIGIDISQYNRDKLKKFLAIKGDYVLAMTGATIGKLGRIYQNEAYINQRVLMFKAKKDTNQCFLYYVLSSYNFSQYILNHIDSESAQANISANTVGKYIFSHPPLDVQKKIAGVLGALDDKIELNNKINQNLEAQAQALFKSWFVDFEPFGGKMPDDWKIGKLGNFIEIKRGGSPRPIQNYISTSGLKWLKISDATSEISPYILTIKECIKPEGLSKTVKLDAGSLVLSNSATPGIPKILDIESCIHDGWLYFPKSNFSNEYLYLLFKYIRNDLISLGNGSVFTNLKTDILKNFEIVIPSISALNDFNKIIVSAFALILKNRREIKNLIELRDTLLPKLMSGEINVDDVEID